MRVTRRAPFRRTRLLARAVAHWLTTPLRVAAALMTL